MLHVKSHSIRVHTEYEESVEPPWILTKNTVLFLYQQKTATNPHYRFAIRTAISPLPLTGKHCGR